MVMINALMVQLLCSLCIFSFKTNGQDDVECTVPSCYCIKKSRKAICNDSDLNYIPRFPKFVTSVIFTNTSLKTIDSNGMFNLSFHRIERLNFTGNQIKNITQDAFLQLPYLSRLVISRETLLGVSILKSSLRSLNSRVKQIEFSYNSWIDLPYDMFSSFNVSHVGRLVLQGNHFTFIHFGTFKPMKRLRYLDLSENRIEKVYISKMSTLDVLDFTNNRLPKILKWCSPKKTSNFPMLRTLLLSNNNIGNIGNKSFVCLPNVETLSMNNLNIGRLQNNVFASLTNLKFLSLSKVGTALRFIEEHAFNSSTLRKLILSQTNFHFDKPRFDPENIFASCTNLYHLDLSGNYLPIHESTIRSMFRPLKRLQFLILASTSLRTLPKHLFTEMPLLNHLSLAANYILGWNQSSEIFGNTSLLQFLSLRQNFITIINKTSFPESLLASLKTIDLARNPFSCTCDQLWFKNWIERTNITIQEYPREYKCRVPNSMNGILLHYYRPTFKICNPWNPLYTMGIIMGAIMTLVLLTSVLVFKCQHNIKNYIYFLRVNHSRRHGYLPLSDEEDYEFHAFVVYCDSDRKWVHGELLEKLENQEGLSLCIHHRNFEVGAAITENVDNFLKKSWKVVVVISNNFAKSEWCQWEVDVVQARRRKYGRHAVLPILLQSIDSKHMTSQLRTLLDSTPCLRYCSASFGAELFWRAFIESLRKPLGHPPVSLI